MQERLDQLGRQVGQVRTGLPEQHAGALGRLEQEIAGLSERIAAFGQERQSQKGTAARCDPRRRQLPMSRGTPSRRRR